jgi:hypothetical protein
MVGVIAAGLFWAGSQAPAGAFLPGFPQIGEYLGKFWQQVRNWVLPPDIINVFNNILTEAINGVCSGSNSNNNNWNNILCQSAQTLSGRLSKTLMELQNGEISRLSPGVKEEQQRTASHIFNGILTGLRNLGDQNNTNIPSVAVSIADYAKNVITNETESLPNSLVTGAVNELYNRMLEKMEEDKKSSDSYDSTYNNESSRIGEQIQIANQGVAASLNELDAFKNMSNMIALQAEQDRLNTVYLGAILERQRIDNVESAKIQSVIYQHLLANQSEVIGELKKMNANLARNSGSQFPYQLGLGSTSFNVIRYGDN